MIHKVCVVAVCMKLMVALEILHLHMCGRAAMKLWLHILSVLYYLSLHRYANSRFTSKSLFSLIGCSLVQAGGGGANGRHSTYTVGN